MGINQIYQNCVETSSAEQKVMKPFAKQTKCCASRDHRTVHKLWAIISSEKNSCCLSPSKPSSQSHVITKFLTIKVMKNTKVMMIIAVTQGGDRNKVSSWGSGREFIGRFIVNINLGSTEAETKAVIFHSSSLFMGPHLRKRKTLQTGRKDRYRSTWRC